MNAKDEGQWWEGEVRVTDDDEHSFGYIYDNRRTPEYDLYELGRDPDPEAIESLVARLNDYDTELNALQQQVTELEGKAALANEAAYNMRRHDWPLMDDGGWLARYDSLTSPSAIAQDERSCRSKECVLPEGHSGLHRNASGYVWYNRLKPIAQEEQR